MNIQVQISGLLIIILIMIFFFGNKKIGLFTERIFSRVLIGSFICLSLDILSVILIVKQDYLSPILVEIVCKAYLVTLLWMGFSGFDYIITDVMKEKVYYRFIHVFMAGAVVESVIICISDINWVHQDRVVYSEGPATTFTYFFTFSFILATIAILFIRYKKLNPRRRMAMGIWMVLWVTSAITQFINNEFLLVGFAIALGMLTIFYMLENPESLQDRSFGCFNSHAMLMFLSQAYYRGEKYSVLDFKFEASEKEAEVHQNLGLSIRYLVQFLEHYKDIKVFKNIEDEIVAFTKDTSMLQNFEEDFRYYFNRLIGDEFDGNSDLLPSLSVITLDDCSRVKSKEDLFSLLSRMQASCGLGKGVRFVTVDNEDIWKYYRFNEVKKEIESALSDNRVEVFYQPIYSNQKKKFNSCEALARIRKPDGSLLSPGEFIPVAESTGLIIQLGERVFTKVCCFLEDNQIIYRMLDYVEINLSVAQFEQKDLAKRFIAIMEQHSIAPSKINLEITETASIQTKHRLLENMKKFLDYGVKFSLDDFGKGQSNLMYVVEMPVSIVKLDMDMTKAYFVEPKARHVVAATVQMAHDLGLHVVAEGVEEKSELEEMEKANIDFIQGYYFSKPLPSPEFIQLLTA